MEPEIARRCQTCGAAVRGTARFCPQCGQLMAEGRDAGAQAPARAQPKAKSALVDQAEHVANSLSGRLAAREPEATAPDGADEDVLSLDAGPVATTGVAETFDVDDTALDAGHVAPSRGEGPVAQANESIVEKATTDDGARASVETSRAEGRGSRPTAARDALADPAPGADGARESESAGEGRGAGRVRRRAAAVGAGLGETVRPRVEKLREASVVVFDEAAEDPGMRFVVIAALLFFVALLILLFSFVLR
jgi:hypothetical protein